MEVKGTAEVLVLALLEARPRHGYELSKLIADRSAGALDLHAASLYPLLYRLERRGLVAGRWIERPGERRRRFYSLTPQGRQALASQRKDWRAFLAGMRSIVLAGEVLP